MFTNKIETLTRGLTCSDLKWHYWEFGISECFKVKNEERTSHLKEIILQKNPKIYNDVSLNDFLNILKRFEDSSFDILDYHEGEYEVLIDLLCKSILVYDKIKKLNRAKEYPYVPEYVRNTRELFSSFDVFKKNDTTIHDVISFWEKTGRDFYVQKQKTSPDSNSECSTSKYSEYYCIIKELDIFKLGICMYKYIAQLTVTNIEHQNPGTNKEFENLIRRISENNQFNKVQTKFGEEKIVHEKIFLTAELNFKNGEEALLMLGILDERKFNDTKLKCRPSGFRNKLLDERMENADYSKQFGYILEFTKKIEASVKKNESKSVCSNYQPHLKRKDSGDDSSSKRFRYGDNRY